MSSTMACGSRSFRAPAWGRVKIADMHPGKKSRADYPTIMPIMPGDIPKPPRTLYD